MSALHDPAAPLPGTDEWQVLREHATDTETRATTEAFNVDADAARAWLDQLARGAA